VDEFATSPGDIVATASKLAELDDEFATKGEEIVVRVRKKLDCDLFAP
jgi:hypothetical protein